jgi:putative ABC transport system permease protein
MLRNHLKIALRTLWTQKGITAINVLGLAAGMAVCLLVGLLFWDQLTHDDFHPGADRIYRVTTEMKEARSWATTPLGLAPALRAQVAGVEAATRLWRTRQNLMLENQAYRTRGYYAAASFFEVFGFELVAGNEETALSTPYSAVLTEELARRLYGESDPLGKTFRLTDSTRAGPFTVTGVLDREAYRSHLAFDVLYSLPSLPAKARTRQGTSYTYVGLGEGQTPSTVAPALRKVGRQHLPPDSTLPGRTSPTGFGLQAVSDVPLSTTRLVNDNAEGTMPPTPAYFLAGLALLVLLAAGFNYVNLSTARSLTRGREVGVRKTMGAYRGQLIGQFVVEAAVVALLAFALAAVFLQGLVPAFNGLSVVREAGIEIKMAPGLPFYGAFLLFAGLVGIVAGLYPAWHLSRFQPAFVLKAGARGEPGGGSWRSPRTVLIVLQFATAIVVIVTATLLYRQTTYMSAAEEAGIRTEHLVHVNLRDVPYGPFQQEVRQIPGVERVGGANRVPLGGVRTAGVSVQSDSTSEAVPSRYYAADYEFVGAISPSFLATGDWSEGRFETGQAAVLNETAVRRLGYESPRAVLGQLLTLSRFGTTWSVRVVGVVQDFYLQFSEGSNHPLVFHYNPSEFGVAVASVVPGREQAVLSALGETWTQFDSGHPVQAHLYRDLIREEFSFLTDIGGVLAFIAGLAVLISCLGLLGIATYTVQTRTREIGIRKALGATVSSIVGLLSKDVLGLVGVAVAVGLPVAWWVNQWWLESFAYRIDPGGWTFVLSAAALVGLALLAVAPQTLRAARIDPARTLRDE